MSLALSEHLPLIAGGPDSIQKLRGLILELAVRGKLVPQDKTAEQAISLIGSIEADNKTARYKTKTFDPITDQEIPFNIPPSWAWARLGSLFKIVYGKGLPTSELTDEGYEVFGANGIIGRYSTYLYEDPQLLVSCRGAYSGKANISPSKCFVTSNSLVLECNWKKLDLRYFFHALSIANKSEIVTGSAQPQVTTTNLDPFVIGVPPLVEQHRIVAKVDELMALCDRLESEQNDSAAAHTQLVETLLGTLTQSTDAADFEANWKRIAEHFDTLFTTEASIDSMKKAVLRLALTGKLVRQSPEDEPADLLLQKIAAKKLQLIEAGNVKSQKPLAEINDNEKPFELPRGWVWARLQNVIDVRDGTHDSPKDSSEPETYPLVTSKNFINGEIDFISARRISALDHFEIAKRSAVEKFDILFSMIGGNLGNQVMVKDERPFSIKNVALFKYYDNKMTSPFFVKKYMEHLAIDLQNQASGGAQPFVSLGHLRNLVFALPPMTEQLRIVAKVDALMSVCESLKAKLAAAEREQSTLADTLIKQALAA